MAVWHEYTWIVVVGCLAAFFTAYGIGANDVANAFGSSVAARTLTMRQALLIASVCEFGGSVLLGGEVTRTVASGIARLVKFEREPQMYMFGMLCALIAAGAWLILATYWELPVSTTHSTAGAVMGFALVYGGPSAVVWLEPQDQFPYMRGMVPIVISWFTGPLLSALATALLFLVVRTAILRRENSLQLAFWALPCLVFFTVFINSYFVLVKGATKKLSWPSSRCAWISAIVATGATLLTIAIAMPLARRYVYQELAARQRHELSRVERQEQDSAEGPKQGGVDPASPDDDSPRDRELAHGARDTLQAATSSGSSLTATEQAAAGALPAASLGQGGGGWVPDRTDWPREFHAPEAPRQQGLAVQAEGSPGAPLAGVVPTPIADAAAGSLAPGAAAGVPEQVPEQVQPQAQQLQQQPMQHVLYNQHQQQPQQQQVLGQLQQHPQQQQWPQQQQQLQQQWLQQHQIQNQQQWPQQQQQQLAHDQQWQQQYQQAQRQQWLQQQQQLQPQQHWQAALQPWAQHGQQPHMQAQAVLGPHAARHQQQQPQQQLQIQHQQQLQMQLQQFQQQQQMQQQMQQQQLLQQQAGNAGYGGSEQWAGVAQQQLPGRHVTTQPGPVAESMAHAGRNTEPSAHHGGADAELLDGDRGHAAQYNPYKRETEVQDDSATASGEDDMPPAEHHGAAANVHWQNTFNQLKAIVLHGTNVDVHEVIRTNPRTAAIHEHAEVFDPATEHAFKYLQVVTAICDSFSHGANDVANSVGPFTAIWYIYRKQRVDYMAELPIWILVIGGAGIVVGLATYGYNIIRAIGVRFSVITPSRGFCIELSTALVVAVASIYGLPISTTHCQVGATAGMGFLEGAAGVDWRLGANFFLGWIVTLLITGGLSAALFAAGAYTPSVQEGRAILQYEDALLEMSARINSLINRTNMAARADPATWGNFSAALNASLAADLSYIALAQAPGSSRATRPIQHMEQGELLDFLNRTVETYTNNSLPYMGGMLARGQVLPRRP